MNNVLARLKGGPWIELGYAAVLLGICIWLDATVSTRPAVIPLESEEDDIAAVGELTPAQEAAIDVVSEMEKLLLSLTGLLIGGVVTIVAKDGVVRPPPPRPARLLLITTFTAAAFSMYFGYFTYVRLLELLDHGVFSAQADQLWEPLEWQYRLFLTSLVGLAAFVALAWFGRREGVKHEK